MQLLRAVELERVIIMIIMDRIDLIVAVTTIIRKTIGEMIIVMTGGMMAVINANVVIATIATEVTSKVERK